MTTIKSYTDLPQSRRLAKILNHESTDMRYEACYVSPKEGIIEYESHPHFAKCIENCIPCWSLAALLDTLPDRICLDNEKYYLNYKKDKVEYLGLLTWDGQKCITSKANTLVDACYEMILKLHELNLL